LISPPLDTLPGATTSSQSPHGRHRCTRFGSRFRMNHRKYLVEPITSCQTPAMKQRNVGTPRQATSRRSSCNTMQCDRASKAYHFRRFGTPGRIYKWDHMGGFAIDTAVISSARLRVSQSRSYMHVGWNDSTANFIAICLSWLYKRKHASRMS